MDITANCDWAGDRLNVALLHEDASDHLAERLDIWFWEVLALSELLYPCIWAADCHDGKWSVLSTLGGLTLY